MPRFNDVSEIEKLEYRIRFEYPDGEEYNSGKVMMTTEQASKMNKLLSALEDDQHICHGWYCGPYYEGECTFQDVVTDLHSEFNPEFLECSDSVEAAWKELEALYAEHKG